MKYISKKKYGNQPDKERLISAVTYLFFKHCEHMFSVHICSAFTYVQRSHMFSVHICSAFTYVQRSHMKLHVG